MLPSLGSVKCIGNTDEVCISETLNKSFILNEMVYSARSATDSSFHGLRHPNMSHYLHECSENEHVSSTLLITWCMALITLPMLLN